MMPSDSSVDATDTRTAPPPTNARQMMRRLLREPVLHFLLIGLFIFLIYVGSSSSVTS